MSAQHITSTVYLATLSLEPPAALFYTSQLFLDSMKLLLTSCFASMKDPEMLFL